MVDGGPRMTIPTQLVLQALLEDPGRELYGVEIGTAADILLGQALAVADLSHSAAEARWIPPNPLRVRMKGRWSGWVARRLSAKPAA